jgi:acyl carrier protein
MGLRDRNVTNIEDVLKAIRPEFDFTRSDDFIGDGMLDSYDMLMLVAELDKTFGISLAGVDIIPEHFRSIATIEQLLHKYGAGS